jgi:hypothetical protein
MNTHNILQTIQKRWLMIMPIYIFLFLWTQTVMANKEAQTPKEVIRKKQASSQTCVGVYYYPWYGSSETHGFRHSWRHVMRQHLKPPQQPKAGLYDSCDAGVIGEHIAQSVRGGISFWAVSWWGPNELKDRVFKDNILTHPDASKLKYAVLYESTGRLSSFDNPRYDNWISDLGYLKKTYFDNPNYLRINGKPVIFVYLSREYFRNRGQDALKQMREQFPEIYIVGDDVYFGDGLSGDYKSGWAKNFDAVTAYDVYGQSIGKYGNTQKSIDYLSKNYGQARQAANSVGTAFMPTIAPGYNDTAVRKGHPGRARYFTDIENSNEGDVFREMLRQVALPNVDPSCDNIIMVTSFNEWYEDSQIEATVGTSPATSEDDSNSGDYYTGGQRYVDYGYLYLDILKEETRDRR